MDKVKTDAAFSNRRARYSFTSTLPSGPNTSGTKACEHRLTTNEQPKGDDRLIKGAANLSLRQGKAAGRKATGSTAQRHRHSSAPDLTYGGTVDMSLLAGNKDGSVARDFNERPLHSVGEHSLVSIWMYS